MASIDNRVVSISFDNVEFQKNVQDTMKSLDDLKTKLNFDEANTSFSGITKSANAVNVSSIASAVDSISSKFSAMGAIAFTVLQNITNKAIDVAGALGKAFTAAPVAQGYSEYELKMGAIQTIIAGTGEPLDKVNQKLQDLNAYSDKTIYSFADMTQNISKFTNAGVSLNGSVAAIQGVANVAAISGANAEEASRAMYNFGQAMGSGVVRLVDWKSIENANMSTVGFKDEIIKTAVELGTLTKTSTGYVTATGEAVTSTQGFTASLEAGWFTGEVLTNTLNRYSDSTTEVGKKAEKAATEIKTFSQLIGTVKESIGSGWSASFEIFIGTFDEAKALMTEVNSAIGGFVGKSAEARNELLSKWKAMGGRTLLIQGLRDAFKSLGTIFAPIKEAFREVFPKKTAEDLYRLTQQFAEFAKNLAISGGTADKVKSIFKGIFSIFKIGIEIVKGIFSLFSNLFSLFSGSAGGGILSFFAKIGDGISSLNDSLVGGNKISEFFNSVFDNIQKLTSKINIQPVIDKLKSFRDTILGIFGGGSDSGASSTEAGGDKVTSIFDKIGAVLSKIGSFGEKVAGVITTIFDGIISFGDKVIEKVKSVWSTISGAFSGANFNKALIGVGAGLFGGVLVLIKEFLNNGIAGIFAGSNVMNSVTKVLTSFSSTLNAFSANLKADALLKIAYAVGIMAASIFLLSFVDAVKVAIGIGALAAAIAILIKALKSLSTIANGPVQSKNLILLSIALGLLAGAILLLSVSLFILSKINLASLSVGMASLIAVLLALVQVAKTLDKDSRALVRAGLSIGLIAVGMIILALAIKIFSMMDPLNIAKGLGVIAVALTGFVASMKLLPPKTDMVNVGAGIILIAIGMLLLAAAIKLMSMMSLWDLAKGVIAMGAAIYAILYAINIIPEKDIMKTVGALLVVSIAMNLIARALNEVANLSVGQLAKGIIAFAAVFWMLGVALKDLEKNGLTGGFALILITYGLGKLVEVFRDMGNLSLGVIIKSLITFALVFAGLLVVAFIAEKLAFGLLVLGATVLSIGAGFFLAGLGIKLFAEGLNLLASAGEKGLKFIMSNIGDLVKLVPKLAHAIGVAIGAFIGGLIDGIPVLIKSLGPALLSIIDLLITLMPKLTALIVSLIDSILVIVVQKTPEIIAAGYTLLLSFLQGMAENIGEITIAVSDIIINFLDALTEKLPEIISAGVDFLVAWLNGITESVDKIAPAVTALIVKFIEEVGNNAEQLITAGGKLLADVITGIGNAAGSIVTAGFNTLMSFLQGISDNIQLAIDKGFDIVIDFLNGVTKSINENADKLGDAGIDLLEAIIKGVVQQSAKLGLFFLTLPFKVIGWIGDIISNNSIIQKGKDIIIGIWDGITERIKGVATWFGNLATTIVGWLGKPLEWLLDVGRWAVEGLWEGIKKAKEWIVEKVEGFVDDLIASFWDFFSLGSPSKVTMEIGMFVGQGLGVGIRDSTRYVTSEVKDLSKATIDNFNIDERALSDKTINSIGNALSTVASNLGNMDEFSPTITPVLDLTGVQKDALMLNSIFGPSPLSTSVAYNQARLISSAETQRATAETTASPTQEVNFNQTINAPTALSTNDIYRQTRSQIAIAKKELSLV